MNFESEYVNNPQASALQKWRRDIDDFVYLQSDEIQLIQNTVAESLQAGVPIQFRHSNSHLGDHMITRAALTLVLKRFSEQYRLNLPSISMSRDTNSGLDILKLVKDIKAPSLLQYESIVNNFYAARLLWLADLLGVEISEQDLLSPPLPMQCDFEQTPMSSFDLQEVAHHVDRFRDMLDKDKHYCVILHGGSKALKRFSRDQVRYIRKVLQSLYPDSGYIILTAQGVDGNGGPELTAADSDLTVDAIENINQTAAVFLAPSNITFVATDTFLAWLGAGMISMRPERDNSLRRRDMYVLNTLASASFWNIAGANHCESFALEHLRQQGRLAAGSDNIIYETDYTQSPVYSENEDFQHVAEADIGKFLRFIVARNNDRIFG